jgi:6-pyruvoyltetrahydropterin/6-carboxytetrahydropterin synthase
MPYRVTKTYPHSLGLSACFRQWRADSHCNQLHGYALAFVVTFEANELDARNWVVDFGSLKSFKGLLEDTFDHRLLVAEDDPELGLLMNLGERGVAKIRVLPRVGCEAFAQYVADALDVWLLDNGYAPRVRVVSVTCSEHEGNAATWMP